ncbi:hypothetical protein B0H19DRAFT_1073052 [Mycena capillaripes]|nr:hypothetical protein B0H19DRAFT_1073052 [Mycena capillaripes]
MPAIERKVNGIAVLPCGIMFAGKSKPAVRLAALWKMLPKLPNLRTIPGHHLQDSGFAKSLTDSKLELPNVTALFLPRVVSVFQRICTNATHVYCVGGNGAALLSGLTDKTEYPADQFDQPIWKRRQNGAEFLHAWAPAPRQLGARHHAAVRHHLNGSKSFLLALKQLTELILTCPAAEENPGDVASIEAARTLLQKSTISGEVAARCRTALLKSRTR